jgi:aldose 1-epimerase
VSVTRRQIDARPEASRNSSAEFEPVTFETFDIDLGSIRVQLLSLGAAIRTVEVPDSHGVLGHVHLHLADPVEHANPHINPHLGGTLGRYANRIAQGTFSLDGIEYSLDVNSDGNTLHGGSRGFDRMVWQVGPIIDDVDLARITFTYHSPDGEMGFPGAVKAVVTYDIAPDAITMEFSATTDAPTVISLANHGYWNLAGSQSIGAHQLSVASHTRLVNDDTGIPVGTDDVKDTLFDLQSLTPLGPVIEATGGLDCCYLVDGEGLRPIAVLSAPAVGRTMRVSSDAPGVQVYTGNNLSAPFQPYQSVSLEAQRAPDAPNQPHLGSSVLRPGEVYESSTVLEFTST